MITLKGEAHTGYGQGMANTDNAVDDHPVICRTARKNTKYV